ncbi:GLPGLI family protein [Flavobacterium sp.]|jgi:GLPGLI family protein|uniref:GLPGLI family protein n=1 Tax=Flavobacterium sp. TaxID=239 RepID=UPI0037C0160C
MIKMKILSYLKSRLCITALLFLSSFSFFSQSLIVDYKVKKNNKNYKSSLVIDNEFSVYTEFYSKIKDSIHYEETDLGSKTIIYNALEDLHFIKNFKNGEIYCKGSILNKKYFVNDSLDIFDWNIKQDTMSFLGLKCQKAILKFRGRNYTAYYTNELKTSDGPWKFNGLPGLILKVTSDDGLYDFEALSISKNKSFNIDYKKFIDDYKNNRIEITFNNYWKEKRQKQEELYLKQKSEFNEKGGRFNKYISIEVFYEYPED